MFQLYFALNKIVFSQQVNNVDLLWLQDGSSSLEVHSTIVNTLINETLKFMKKSSQESRFGLSSYIDKPVGDFGFDDSDYCYKSVLPLQNLDSDDLTTINEFSSLVQYGSGNDWEENPLEALAHSVLSPNTEWKQNHRKVVVIATDAGFHYDENSKSDLLSDALALAQDEDSINRYAEPIDSWCTTSVYPSLTEIYRLVRDQNLSVVFLVTEEVFEEYMEFANVIGTRYVSVVKIDGGNDKQVVINYVSAIKSGFKALEHKTSSFNVDMSKKYVELLKLLNEVPSLGEYKESFSNDQNKTLYRSKTIVPEEAVVPDDIFEGLEGNIDYLMSHCSENTVFEIVVAQDASDGFSYFKESLAEEYYDSFNILNLLREDSRYGMLSFVDKPIHPHGFAKSFDYCSAMQTKYMNNDPTEVRNKMKNLMIRSGNDEKEAQLHALIHPTLSMYADYTKEPRNADGKRVVRIVLLVTDSEFHVEGDSLLAPYSHTARHYDCAAQDYPGYHDVSDALTTAGVFPMVLVVDRADGNHIADTYTDLLKNKTNLNGYVGVLNHNDDTKIFTNFKKEFFTGLNTICNYRTVNNIR